MTSPSSTIGAVAARRRSSDVAGRCRRAPGAEKAATCELDAIAAQRRRLPAVVMPDYTLVGADGPVRLVDEFDGRRQLIVYNHMWHPGEDWQCGGCTSFTAQFTRFGFLDPYDARFVIVTQGPIDDALAYKAKVGNQMEWYSTADSPFGADVRAPRAGLRPQRVPAGRRRHRVPDLAPPAAGVEQLAHTFALVDVLPYGRQESGRTAPTGPGARLRGLARFARDRRALRRRRGLTDAWVIG